LLGCFYIKCLLDNQCVIWTNNASLGSLFSNQQKGINMADLLGRVHRKQFYLLILMTLFISSCGDDNDNDIEQPVLVTNSAPAISSADTDTASLGTLFTYTLTASDADGDALTFQASLLPAWLAFNATSGELSGTPPAGSAGDYQVTLAASDGVDSTPLFLTISIANSAPVITSTANNNGVVGKAYSYTLTANDANTDTLVYSSVTVPSWATFDVTSRTLSGTPPTTGDFETELSVSDGEAAVNQKFTLVITDQPSVVIGFDETVVFSNFGGAVADIITNPDKAGINTSDKVGRMQKFAGETFGGTTISLDDPITLAAKLFFGQEMSSQFLRGKSIAANNMFTLKVWSQRQVALTFKLEGDVDANDVERVVTHDGTGWEVLNFDFTGVTGTGYTAITLIFDNGVLGDAAEDAANWTFYFDDMVIPVVADTSTDDGNGSGQTATNVNGFENAADSYMFSDFAGGVANVITNPDQSGINTSAQTGQMLKFAGEVFGGSTLTLDTPVDVPAGSVFTLKVWSSRAVTVLFKLEGMNVERVVNHSGSGWEQLTFDFTGDMGTAVSAITLIFDIGVMGDAENNPADWTFYFDDLTTPAVADDSGTDDGSNDSGQTTTNVNGFENAADSYMFSDFAGGVASIVTNPDQSGINTSAQTGQMLKFAGEVFGGSTLTLDTPVDVPAGSVFTLKVWSSRAVTVLFKLEGMNVERVVNHSGSGWEQLTFDFTGDMGTAVPAITLIFDIGVMGDAENNPADWTFYFDDLTTPAVADGGSTDDGSNNSGQTTTNVNGFENAADSYMFSDFAGGVANVITNPDQSGINTSAQTGQMLKFAGEVFGGSTLTLDGAVDIPVNAIIMMKVWSQRAVDVLFKLEGGPVGEVTAVHGGTGWEELRFDFTGISGVGTTGVTLIFDNGTVGDAANDAANWTFYFDDLTFPVAVDSGTGSGTGGAELTTNGDLEAGDLSGWVAAANDGMITADNTQASGSTWSAHVVAGPLHNPAFSQAGLAVGTVKPGDKIDISFDMCGTAASGGIIFPALLSEFGGDTGADRQTLDTIATPPSVWTRYNYSAVAGSNVNGGISLQLDVVCGADAACKADVYFDNVSVTIGGGPAAGSASGNSCVAGDTGSTSRSNIDFEGMADSYTFSDFGGGVASVITNPDISGINTSAQVGQMMKFAGEVYGGSTLSLDSAIDVADGSIFTLKVWSNRVVAVLFKLEGMNVERIVNHGGMGWEELTFDFTGDTGTGVPAVTLIFDLGVMGDADNTPADWTFYFDDMTLPSVTTDSGTSGSGLSAINFETGGAGAAYTWAVFENSDNPALEIIANPYTSGVNTSATVAKFTARVDGQVYAGVESAHGDFGPLTLDATNSIVKIMVWKSVISDVGIKFAIANGGAKGEIKVPNTQTNQWEEITFDFSGNIGAAESINIDQIIIFPDFNARGAETVSYFDNITFGN